MASDTTTSHPDASHNFPQTPEAQTFEEIHKHAIPFLPPNRGLMLHIGAGSAQTAAWFAHQNWNVIAAQPTEAPRNEAARPNTAPNIRWINDSLPSLSHIQNLGLAFDLVWLSEVWMHLPPEHRPRAMRNLAMSLKPGGRLVITRRHAPTPHHPPIWPVNAQEIERLGLDVGLALRVATEHANDISARPDVKWQTIILDMPNDGAGALPLLRGVILRQQKSSTYKLALLRCITRIADSSANAARDAGDHIELPLGLIALYWIRMFKPLIANAWPQRPGQTTAFSSADSYKLPGIAPHALRPGARFTGETANTLRHALTHAASLITAMPARHLTYANDTPIFETHYGKSPARTGTIAMDHELLWRLGTTRIPRLIWIALRRMSAWIEPMLIAEWARMMQNYAAKRGETKRTDSATEALAWIEPERDTNFVRDIVRQKRNAGHRIHCIWSGRLLTENMPHIDHCLPWSAWPCNDLWNLVPAAQSVNLAKSGRLVTSLALAEAKPRMIAWWQQAYLEGAAPLKTRFAEEALFSLPLQKHSTLDLDDLFSALDFRRLRLQQDTQAPEWPRTPPGPAVI